MNQLVRNYYLHCPAALYYDFANLLQNMIPRIQDGKPICLKKYPHQLENLAICWRIEENLWKVTNQKGGKPIKEFYTSPVDLLNHWIID